MQDGKTVGQISTELSQKPQDKVKVIDQADANQQDYIQELINCAEINKKLIDGDFYITVETKAERLLQKVFRNYFYATLACPTPKNDQSVFKYSAKDEQISYLWTVPCEDACIYLRNNALLVDPAERESLMFVLDYYSGDLLKLAKRLNGEADDSPLLVN